jgi:excisionase family DNA binding protein
MDVRVRKEIAVETEGRDWRKVPEAATYFRVPRSRMYDLIQKGELPAVRIGRRSIRVDIREVDRILAENRRVGPDSA